MMTGIERLYLGFGQSFRNFAAVSLPDGYHSTPAYIYQASRRPEYVTPVALSALGSLA
jgi:hypothetical protein